MNINTDIFKIQSNNVMPSRGKILISEPFLHDVTFGRSVVLLVDHTEEGSMGLIINKPLPLMLNDIIKEFKYMEDIPLLTTDTHFDMSTAYANRPEIRSLELATQIYKQKVNVTRAEHLPSIALMGNYMVTNPSVFNSFENKFKGMWNVGVMVQIPIWHWGEGIYKTRAAKSEVRIAQYQLQDAREKIELQVNQAAFKVNEAGKKLVMSTKNMEKAEENLRYATLGFAALQTGRQHRTQRYLQLPPLARHTDT